jgi:hypothetical protein
MHAETSERMRTIRKHRRRREDNIAAHVKRKAGLRVCMDSVRSEYSTMANTL